MTLSCNWCAGRRLVGLAGLTLLIGACGAKTGLSVQDSEDGSVRDVVAVDVPVRFDAPVPVDAGPDVPVDAPMEIDGWVPECPDSVRVRGREASIPVDTIWALDTSFSMADDLERLRANVSVFWNALAAANIDSQTVFVAQDGYAPPPPAGFAGRFIAVNEEVGSWDALLRLTGSFRYYGPRLRPDAVTHFIVVTDDDSRYQPWEDFFAAMTELLGHEFIFHAVASEQLPPTVDNPRGVCTHGSGGADRAGVEYYEMADATGGLKMSICNEDWSELFTLLNERVAIRVPLRCAFSLPPLPPAGITYNPDRFTVLANVPGEAGPRVVGPVADEASCGPSGGWWYFAGSKRIQLCETTCDQYEALDATIEVDLGCSVD